MSFLSRLMVSVSSIVGGLVAIVSFASWRCSLSLSCSAQYWPLRRCTSQNCPTGCCNGSCLTGTQACCHGG